MKLYIYDHCPFCVRPRLLAGIRQIPLETIILLNDDEATPISFIGAKQVPILQKNDGSYMGESLDIVNELNALSGHQPLQAAREEVETWFKNVNHDYQRLTMPRTANLPLAEFATAEAKRYYIDKKEKNIGDFAQHLQQTPDYLAKMQAHLAILSSLVQSDEALNGQDLSMEDILIFPILRNLTMVRNMTFPENILRYLNKMSEKSGVSLYHHLAQ